MGLMSSCLQNRTQHGGNSAVVVKNLASRMQVSFISQELLNVLMGRNDGTGGLIAVG